MLEPISIDVVRNAHDWLVETCNKNDKSIPVNKGAIRKLDSSVIKCVHQYTKDKGLRPYDTVRSAFNEGSQIYPYSNFYDRLHIEICVRNPGLIKSYFLPMPTIEFNPYLKTG